MTEPRQVKFDVEATVLAGLCLFLWVSLLTYNAADPVGPLTAPLSYLYQPAVSVYPPNARIENWCGWCGALAAQLMVDGLGNGALPLVAGLSALTLWMFRVQDNFVAPARQVGWMLVILGLTTLATLVKLQTPYTPPIGSGGYLGALTTTWLAEHFAVVGSVILTLALIAAGLLLSTDYWVLRGLGWFMAGTATFVATAITLGSRRIAGANPWASEKASPIWFTT
jgi:S-DNA-T family DNA segregation ATPase FtsK/SpoIIIE